MVKESSPQNFDNTLFPDEDFLKYTRTRDYYQKVKAADDILIQFATDATSLSAEVYDEDDVLATDVTSNITEVVASTNFSIYNLEFNIGGAGVYYLKLTIDGIVYRSELFQIATSFVNTIEIEYNTSENDGVVYSNDETFVINVEGRFAEYKAGSEKETYSSFNQRLVNLKSYPLRMILFEFGGLPRYMVEKLNIALQHEVVKINGVQYQSEEGIENELIRDEFYISERYKGQVQMRQVVYENYETAIEEEPVDTFRIEQNVNRDLLIIDDIGSNIIWKS
jgi:hypothetical protein